MSVSSQVWGKGVFRFSLSCARARGSDVLVVLHRLGSRLGHLGHSSRAFAEGLRLERQGYDGGEISGIAHARGIARSEEGR